MLDLIRGAETVSGYLIRAWTGPATDEGVGLISMVEVSDNRGVPVCRFEEFLDATLQRAGMGWPSDDGKASRLLQDWAIERARTAVLGQLLSELHGHRFDVPAGATPLQHPGS